MTIYCDYLSFFDRCFDNGMILLKPLSPVCHISIFDLFKLTEQLFLCQMYTISINQTDTEDLSIIIILTYSYINNHEYITIHMYFILIIVQHQYSTKMINTTCKFVFRWFANMCPIQSVCTNNKESKQ